MTDDRPNKAAQGRYSLTSEQKRRVREARDIENFHERLKALTDIAADVVVEHDIQALRRFGNNFGTYAVVGVGQPNSVEWVFNHLADFAAVNPEIDPYTGGENTAIEAVPDEMDLMNGVYLAAQMLYGEAIADRLERGFPERGLDGGEGESDDADDRAVADDGTPYI